ncbi:MAG TPA: ABC transporter permease, partial [Thermoanaerobaculia bacterium]|nr:ABC transporter permease [Thermoanaerobaculia bacterium]
MTRHILKMVWNRKRANVLIVAEIFLSFLVLFAVLTLASALLGSVRKPLGFEWRNVWNISVNTNRPPDQKAPESEQQSLGMLIRELQALPEIAAVGASATPPYAMSSNEGTWMIGGKSVSLTHDFVTDGFADVMQMKLVAGRWFIPADDAASFTPIVIDADLARDVYGSENPVNQKFNNGGEKDFRVVGVVAPYRKSGEFANFGRPINMMFERVSVMKGTMPDNLLIRLRPGTPASFEQTLNARLHQIAPDMNFRIRQMDRMRTFAHRMVLLPLTILAGIAAFLIVMVVLGLSGVLWQNVTRRRREIGLRRAIGATG